ncbi:hypothetical protein C8J57DRAFT_1366069 [Mycena rebaudengoi]|nr:hypothetical protein C8J57DRAFT_1366069 [Mycena rebaudengoi]
MPFVNLLRRGTSEHGRLPSTPHMPDSAQDNLQLLQLVADSRLTGYLAGTCVSSLLNVRLMTAYDHVVCFSDEVELMWKSRWGFAKIIYQISLHRGFGYSSSEVWILYGRRRWVVWLFIFMAIVDLFAYAEMTGMSLIKGCYAYNVPRFLTLYAAAPLLVTFIMFLLTLYKCGVTLHRNDHRIMPIWNLFLRDGVVWFLAVFAAGGSELIIWISKRETLKQLLVVVYSTVASRAILNIKNIMSSESESDGITVSCPDPIVFAPV